MNQLYVPSKIRLWIDKKPYIVDNVGMSGNQVLIFEDMVLKIEENPIVVRRQLEVMKWLEGKISAPKVIEYEEENGISSNETSLNEYSSLEEKIEEDILPELPPLEEEQLETQIDNDISTTSIQEEPQIQQTNNKELEDNNSEQNFATDNSITEKTNNETNTTASTEANSTPKALWKPHTLSKIRPSRFMVLPNSWFRV